MTGGEQRKPTGAERPDIQPADDPKPPRPPMWFCSCDGRSFFGPYSGFRDPAFAAHKQLVTGRHDLKPVEVCP
jgi:hypothetical protein